GRRAQRDDGAAVREHTGGGADVVGSALGVRHVGEAFEEERVVRLVEGPAGQVVATGKALRSDTGRSAQRVHDDTGIISDHWQPAARGEVTRLRKRVLAKRRE